MSEKFFMIDKHLGKKGVLCQIDVQFGLKFWNWGFSAMANRLAMVLWAKNWTLFFYLLFIFVLLLLILSCFSVKLLKWIIQLKNFKILIFKISTWSCSYPTMIWATGLLQWDYFMDHKLATIAATKWRLMVEIVRGYVTSADVCMVTQSPRKYSINYVPPPPSTSENYKNLIKFMCVEKSIGRVVQTVDDGRNFGEIGKVGSRISTFYVNPDDFWTSIGRFIAWMYLVEVLGFEALRDLETAEMKAKK
jgi:hypothetical protein